MEKIKKFFRSLHWNGLIPHVPMWGAEEWMGGEPIPWRTRKARRCTHAGCFKTLTSESWEEDFGRGWVRRYPLPKKRIPFKPNH
jgi:hypothetical protein